MHPSRTLEGNSRKRSESVSGVFPEFLPESPSRTGGMAHKNWWAAILIGDSESIFRNSDLLRSHKLLCFSLWKFWQFLARDSGNHAARDSQLYAAKALRFLHVFQTNNTTPEKWNIGKHLKRVFIEWGQGIQWMQALMRNSTGKAIRWRGQGHSVNSWTLTIDFSAKSRLL